MKPGVTDIPVRTLRSAAVYLNIPVSRLVTENDERFLSGFNTGTRLLLCRLMTRQTRTEVAATVDISARQLARYEMNQCRIRQSTLSALAAVFEVSCAWLLKSAEQPQRAEMNYSRQASGAVGFPAVQEFINAGFADIVAGQSLHRFAGIS